MSAKIEDVKRLSNSADTIYLLTRHGLKKGYGLYKCLQDILDKEADYIAACKEANAKYDAEIGPLKERIAQEYAQKRSALGVEMQSKINEATKTDDLIRNLNNQLAAMNAEYSKLGLFSGRRKKELQAQIWSAMRQLNWLQSSDQVRHDYEQRISKLDSEEKTAISKAEQTVRAKYPLPQK